MTASKPPAKTVNVPDPIVAPVVDVKAVDGQTIAQEVAAGIMKNPASRSALALTIALGGTIQYVASSAYIALIAAHIVTAPPVWLAIYSAVFSPIATVGGWVWKANISGKKTK